MWRIAEEPTFGERRESIDRDRFLSVVVRASEEHACFIV
jgi:hypothetical protein